MRIYTYWMQRKEQYPDEFGPELLVAWDVFCHEANPKGFEEAVEKAKAEYHVAECAAGTAFITLDVNYGTIRGLCLQTHLPLKAEVIDSQPDIPPSIQTQGKDE